MEDIEEVHRLGIAEVLTAIWLKYFELEVKQGLGILSRFLWTEIKVTRTQILSFWSVIRVILW